MIRCTELVRQYSWMASYLINNNSTGYSKDELAQIEKFEEELKEIYGSSIEVMDCSQDSEFGTPDYGGLKGDLVAYTVRFDPYELPSEHWDNGYKQEVLKSRYW